MWIIAEENDDMRNSLTFSSLSCVNPASLIANSIQIESGKGSFISGATHTQKLPMMAVRVCECERLLVDCWCIQSSQFTFDVCLRFIVASPLCNKNERGQRRAEREKRKENRKRGNELSVKQTNEWWKNTTHLRMARD